MDFATKDRNRRSGYVLIMTLVMIAIAALSLSGLARQSLLLAGDSIVAQRELQHHWGARSCRNLLLARAEDIFEQMEFPFVEGKRPWPAPRMLTVEFVLGGMAHRLWLGDEEAKVNLNSLTARMPQQRRPILNQLASQLTTLQLDSQTDYVAKKKKRPFATWGQVVDVSQLGTPGAADSLLELAADVTCWGNGKLNIRRVSNQTLLLLATRIVNQKVAHKLLKSRVEATKIDWKNLLMRLALHRRDELALNRWFTDRSTCYSLWLELDDGQRRWYHQWVEGDRNGAASDGILSFRW